MKLKRWEIALAVGIIVAVLAGGVGAGAQAELSGKIIRLHVVANSDGDCDQALKLAVRDAVLAEVEEGDSEVTDALLERIERAAAREIADEGFEYGVRVTRERMYFDTRVYEDFALPAGYYDAVRVVIGEGAGRNWWCVIFPPLCAGVEEAEFAQVARQAGLSEDEVAFIRGDGSVYVMRFKLAEAWGRMAAILGGE